jgi:hypothetical protein
VADVVQLPGLLNFLVVKGDQIDVRLNLNTNITGYTFTSQIYASSIVGTGGGSVDTITGIANTVTQPILSIVSQTAGTMLIGLSENQTNLLDPLSTYRWYLRAVAPGVVTRTILAGEFTTVAP